MSKVEDSTSQKYIHVRSRWDYVKKKLKRRGVVEVNETHPHYDMLCAIRVGIKRLLTEFSTDSIQEEFTPEDYTSRMEILVQTQSNKTYQFQSYASSVFRCLRMAVDVKEEDILQNLGFNDIPYLEFISNSRSGQDFYFSNNQRFILKTDKKHCVQHFLSFLPEYLAHFQTYPHSLLVKFLGVYSIKQGTSKKKYFLVMQSIFYPTMRLEDRFDIKGCLANRYQNPKPSGSQTILILKDKNFLEEKIKLGSQKEWFSVQLKADVDFLLSLGVQDYSLLLGRHSLQKMDKRESVVNLYTRIKNKTVEASQNTCDVLKQSFPHEMHTIPNNDLSQDEGKTTSLTQIETYGSALDNPESHQNSSKGSAQQTPSNTSQAENSPVKQPSSNSPKRHRGFLRSLWDTSYLDSTGLVFENRRLLLNCDNNLHIIDGTEHRYYIGIIDFFTLFQCRQHVGKFLKDIKTCCGNHSTEPPDVYARRFYDFIIERTV